MTADTRPHDRDLSRSVTCDTCGSVCVPLNTEPNINFCLSPECGAPLAQTDNRSTSAKTSESDGGAISLEPTHVASLQPES
jgi:hypothetical protein